MSSSSDAGECLMLEVGGFEIQKGGTEEETEEETEGGLGEGVEGGRGRVATATLRRRTQSWATTRARLSVVGQAISGWFTR